MEESKSKSNEEVKKSNKKCNPLEGGGRRRSKYQAGYPALLPLPLPPPLLLPPLLSLPRSSSTTQAWKYNPCASNTHHLPLMPLPADVIKVVQQKPNLCMGKEEGATTHAALDCHSRTMTTLPQTMATARRPDSGGREGPAVSLLANHFPVRFDPSRKIFQYEVDIYPHPTKEIARMIKTKLVRDNSDLLSGAIPAFDGRKSLYSATEFQDKRLEFFVRLPILRPVLLPNNGGGVGVSEARKPTLFKVSLRLASILCGEDLSRYLSEEEGDGVPLPQDYLHALDVVLRESSAESCIQVGRSLYSPSMGGVQDIGGGAIALRGFFQSLRPTQQGLALNVDFSVAAFHESIGIIPYLQKRCEFLKDLPQRKTRGLVGDERREVERALKNIRIFVCHRETNQRYRVFGLTDEATENLKFKDKDGRELMLVDYFRDQYNQEIQFRDLPCLKISRSKPCYLPMELCMVCEGQKFLGKLSDEQTARILKMGCQKPAERKDTINGLVNGSIGSTSVRYAEEFNLQVSRQMTQLTGRVLQPPSLRFGDGGSIRVITPNRYDRQWNLLDSHVPEGSKISRWALISFGGSQEQRSSIPRFIKQLSNRCEQLGILLSGSTVVGPIFESIQLLNNVSLLECKLRKMHEAAAGSLQLLVCVMEKKHRGYGDLKRISETQIGVLSQCCLYSNLGKLTSQFLANLALKINAKAGGCNVVLYNTLPCQIPRLFADDEPVIFMGADVTHPHPLDDSSPSVAAVVGSMNWPAANKYISRMRSQTHRQEIIEDLEEMVWELLEDFVRLLRKLPGRIIFFRDGVSETQFRKVLEEELRAISSACSRFKGYKPKVTFSVVQKRHHTRLFLKEKKKGGPSGHRLVEENIPPGTVVDATITHPREFDFYLCSHWGMKGTSRPTHYHVLRDENHFASDELQKLIHSLCYTFVRCTKPVSLVPPAYYAHLAAYRGRLYLERTDSAASRGAAVVSRAGPPRTLPLPKLRESVKKLMFYC